MLTEEDIKNLIKAQKEAFVIKEEIESLIEIVATKEELKKVEEKMDKIATKDDIKNLSKQTTSLSEDLKVNNKLEMRVDYIENILNIPTKK